MEKLAAIKMLAQIILDYFILGITRKLKSGSYYVFPFMLVYIPIALIYLGVVYVVMFVFWIMSLVTALLSNITNSLLRLAKYLSINSTNNILTLLIYPIVLALYLPLVLLVLVLPKTVDKLDLDV